MRSRLIVGLLFILLAPFGVSSTQAARGVDFAETRSSVRLVRNRPQKERIAVPFAATFGFPEHEEVSDRQAAEQRLSLRLFVYTRFQRPPPANCFAA